MIHSGACWDQQQLQQALEGPLSSAEESTLATHLESCGTCREGLERLAAERGDWAAVRNLQFEEALYGIHVGLDHWSPVDATLGFLAPSDDPAMLGRLGAYEVRGVIGHGGMGIVLKGFDLALNRNVAIKVLAPQLAASAVARRRFAREARAAAAVVHEHVVPIHAVAEFNGLPYLVMPYFPGKSLQRRIDETGPLAVPEILRIGRQISSGLAAAHAQGLVHRDIKPANILLENGVERVVITDFGLARTFDDASLTCSGVIAGTPQYMAPEQARGDLIDHRSDLFSLGSVLYAMCTGRPPFRADNAVAVLRRICDEEPRPVREINPDVPDWLAGIIERLHAKEPRERFVQAEHVAELLEASLAHVQSPMACPLPAELLDRTPLRRESRRKLRAAVWSAVVVLAAAAMWDLSSDPVKTGESPSASSSQKSASAAEHRAGLLHVPEDTESVEQISRQIDEIRAGWSAATDVEAWELEKRISELRNRALLLEREMREEQFPR